MSHVLGRVESADATGVQPTGTRTVRDPDRVVAGESDRDVAGESDRAATGNPDPATGRLGRFLARDGSVGAPVGVDLEYPHVALVVGKRGYGKSYTLGVLAEELAAAGGVTAVVVDPMGVFCGLADGCDARVVREPAVRADALPPPAWPGLFGLDPTGPAGSLLWQAAATAPDAGTPADLRAALESLSADGADRRAVLNHLDLADTWGVFRPDGLTPEAVLAGRVTVLDCAGLPGPATGAVVRALAAGIYDRAVSAPVSPLPWLLVDEAHALFDGVAGPALRTLLTRGRQPGVSLALATQRPGALPPVAVSQADLVVAHRLTAEADLDALERARPAGLGEPLDSRLPTAPGEAIVVDDATESAHTVRVRERRTPHRGDSPTAGGRRERAADAPDRSRVHSERTE